MEYELAKISSAVWTSETAKKVDELSIDSFQIPAMSLMENAGKMVAIAAASRHAPGAPYIALVGSGNNGGDAIVALRWLNHWGFDVKAFCLTLDPSKQSNQLKEQLQLARSEGLAIHPLEEIRTAYQGHGIVIDGFFGIGLNRPLKEGPIKSALSHVSQCLNHLVIAVDIPSGLSGNLWGQEKPPLLADLTITFGGKKPVHLSPPSNAYCGEVKVFPIGFHPEANRLAWDEQKEKLWEVDPQKLNQQKNWSQLDRNAHKFQRGHVLVIGGSPGKTGAPILAAMAAKQAGAGWVTLATPTPSPQAPAYLTSEELFQDESTLDQGQLLDFLKSRKVKALILGPGTMGNLLTPTLCQQLASCIAEDDLNLVLDAGCTHRLSEMISTPLDPKNTIVTPHPGETIKSGLVGDQLPINLEGLSQLNSICESFGISLLYKTSCPILVSPLCPQQYFCYSQPNNHLAQAGSGDILTGIIAGLILSGMPAAFAGIVAQHYLVEAACRASDGMHPTPFEVIKNIRIR